MMLHIHTHTQIYIYIYIYMLYVHTHTHTYVCMQGLLSVVCVHRHARAVHYIRGVCRDFQPENCLLTFQPPFANERQKRAFLEWQTKIDRSVNLAAWKEFSLLYIYICVCVCVYRSSNFYISIRRLQGERTSNGEMRKLIRRSWDETGGTGLAVDKLVT